MFTYWGAFYIPRPIAMLFFHIPIKASLAYKFDGMFVKTLNEFTAIRWVVLILKSIIAWIIVYLGGGNHNTAAQESNCIETYRII